MSDLQALIVLRDEIAKLITDNDAPIENPQIIARIRFLTSWTDTLDGYCYRRLQDIANEAEMFYNPRKQITYYSEAAQCHARMRRHLKTIDNRIAEIKATTGK
jgi:hypothetical protein